MVALTQKPVWRKKTRLTSPEVWAAASSVAWRDSGGASFSPPPSGKLPTHPTPTPCFSLTCNLRPKTWIRGGAGGQFPSNLIWFKEALLAGWNSTSVQLFFFCNSVPKNGEVRGKKTSTVTSPSQAFWLLCSFCRRFVMRMRRCRDLPVSYIVKYTVTLHQTMMKQKANFESLSA